MIHTKRFLKKYLVITLLGVLLLQVSGCGMNKEKETVAEYETVTETQADGQQENVVELEEDAEPETVDARAIFGINRVATEEYISSLDPYSYL